MEIINPNSLPGGNARACGTDALLPPHSGENEGCGMNADGCPMACTVAPPCYENE